MNEMDFLTAEEREQMDALMEKAAERMRKKEEDAPTRDSCQFLFLHYQQECSQRIEQKKREKEAAFEHDIAGLLCQICSFCQKYGIPVCRNIDLGDEDDNDDNELPF